MFSPSVNVGQTWEAVKTVRGYVTKVREPDDDKLYVEHYNSSDLEQTRDTIKNNMSLHCYSYSMLIICFTSKSIEH